MFQELETSPLQILCFSLLIGYVPISFARSDIKLCFMATQPCTLSCGSGGKGKNAQLGAAPHTHTNNCNKIIHTPPQFYRGFFPPYLSRRDPAHLLKSSKVYSPRLPEFPCLKPQLWILASRYSLIKLILSFMRESHHLYLGTNSSQHPFIIQCGYFLKMYPNKRSEKSSENVKSSTGGQPKVEQE